MNQSLNANKILTALPCRVVFQVFDEIDSTNIYLLKKAEETGKTRIAVAELQTHGRGQHGRPWHTLYGQNLCVSVLYSFTRSPATLQSLSLALGVSLVEALEKLGIKELKLKWPNDLFYRGQKLGGILVETTVLKPDSCKAVIGIGLNVNMEEHAEVDQPWTSLKKITRKAWDREKVLITILQKLLVDLSLFNEEGYGAFQQKILKYESP